MLINHSVSFAPLTALSKITPDGTVSTLAGMRKLDWQGRAGNANGLKAAAQFNYPSGIAVDANDDLFVADSGNYAIRKLTQSGAVSTFAGKAGEGGSTDVTP